MVFESSIITGHAAVGIYESPEVRGTVRESL